MNSQRTISRLKRLQAEIDQIRKKLDINAPQAVLYYDSANCGDRFLLVEADGFGGATTSVIKGFFPENYNTCNSKQFPTEEAAIEAAVEIVERDADPEDILSPS